MKKLQALLVEVDPGIHWTIRNSSAKGLDVVYRLRKWLWDNTVAPLLIGWILQDTSQNFMWVDQYNTNWRKEYNNPIVYESGDQVVGMGTSN
jgi:hypothetical protein